MLASIHENKGFNIIWYIRHNSNEQGIKADKRTCKVKHKEKPILSHKPQNQAMPCLWKNMFQLWKSTPFPTTMPKLSQESETVQAEMETKSNPWRMPK